MGLSYYQNTSFIGDGFLVGWTMQPSISKEMINIVKSTITQRF